MTPPSHLTAKFIRNVIWKTLLLLVILNFGFIFIDVESMSSVSAYNVIFPGRDRFPFGENAQKAYNLSLSDLSAMFQSHRLDGEVKQAEDFRVFFIGDSSVWGSLLTPEESLTGQIGKMNLKTCEGRNIEVYNLGYPTLSLTKDLMVLEEAYQYKPDLIVWMTTLEAFPLQLQVSSPLVAENPGRLQKLIEEYDLPIEREVDSALLPSWWDQSFIGKRRELADLVRLQLFGVMWAATGIDQDYPETYPAAKRDFNSDETRFHGLSGPDLPEDFLGFSILEAGIANSDVPVLMVNEPILVSHGENSQLRYNFYYPRWAYDQYRQYLVMQSQQTGWPLLDVWNLVDESEFTNSAIHLTSEGTSILAREVGKAIIKETCR